MPIFCFTHPKRGTIEHYFPIGTNPLLVKRDGVVYTRDMNAEAGTMTVSGKAMRIKTGKKVQRRPGSTYPRKSDALGVNPDQIDEAEAADRKHGLNSTYDRETGELIIPDKGFERAYMKHHGFIDKSKARWF